MAFVYRSTKGSEFMKKEDLNESNTIKEKLELLREKKDNSIFNNNSSYSSNNSVRIKAPFGTLSKKCELPNMNGLSVPGPGTYDINDSLKKKYFNKNNTSPDVTKNENEEIKRQFITQQKRFNENQYETDVPGPGKYYKEKKNKKFYKTLSNQIFLYNKELNNYEPFSTSRILSIPPKGNDFGYDIFKNGQLKLIEDPNKDQKFTGNKNDSVGPGQYNSYYNQRNNKIGIIDWNKSVHRSVNKKKEKEVKRNEKEESNKNIQFNNSHNESNYFLSNTSTEPTVNNSLSIMNFNKKNRTKNYFYTNVGFDRTNIEIKFSNNKIFKNDNFSRTINRRNLSPFFKLDIKRGINLTFKGEDNSPGPGAYLPLNTFIFPSKDERHQFFGSSMSRGIMNPNLTNNAKIGKIPLDSLLDIENYSFYKNNLNKSKSFNSDFNNKKSLNEKHKKKKNIIEKIDKVEIIKEVSKSLKKENEKNLGPGSYNPEIKIKNTFSCEVGNFGSLERRFPLYPSKEEFPGAGNYFHLETWGPKKRKNTLEKIIPPNISKKLKEGISANKIGLFRDKIMKENHKQPIIGQYSIENINTIDSKVKKSISIGKNQPGFGSSFKRFYIFKNQINEKNGVGNYNLEYPNKKIIQQNYAFLGSAGRNDIDDYKKNNLINPECGPGSYKCDSYFDWNKKSYNILFN